MSEYLTALLEPQVLVAFITFVVAPIVTVLVAAKRQPVPVAPSTPDGKAAGKAAGRMSIGDSVLMEAFAQWSDAQAAEIAALKKELGNLRVEIGNLKRLVLYLRQHNAVITEQLIRAGETPLVPANPEEYL